MNVFAKLFRFKTHKKLDFPNSGPFKVVGEKGGSRLNYQINKERTI